MDGNNKLSRINNNDNNSRLMFAIIGLLVVLIIALCLYIFVFDKDEPGKNESKEPELSKTEDLSEEGSLPVTENSEAGDTSAAEESTPEQSAEPVSESVSKTEESVPEVSEPSEESSGETSEEAGEPEHGWVINNLGYTYLYDGRGFEQFTYSSSIAESYASSLAALAAKCGSANVYSILVPTNCEFGGIPNSIKREDDFYCSSQKNFTDKVYSLTDGKIVNVNVYDAISARVAANDYMYYNSDPNYTCLGAYTVYTEFCKAAGLKAVSDTVYDLKIVDDSFLGRFYTATGSESVKKNADILYYYDIDSAYTASEKVYRRSGIVNRDGVIFTDVPSYSYYCFLGEDARRIDVATNTKSGKKLLVIGDTSASPLVTLLVPHYDSITFVNSTLQTEDISDILASSFDDVLIVNYNTNAGRLIYKNINAMAGKVNG